MGATDLELTFNMFRRNPNSSYARVSSSHRRTELVTIEREDGVTLRLTSLDRNVVRGLFTFAATGGIDVTARRGPGGLQEQDQDLQGFLSAAPVTEEDLKADRYLEARVTVEEIDWGFPFVGPFSKNVYRVARTEYDGATWRMELTSLASLLARPKGGVFSRLCQYNLGDASCGVDLAALRADRGTADRTVTSVDSGSFGSDVPVELGAGYANGTVSFVTGDNAGVSIPVASLVSGTIKPMFFPPLPIEVGDTFHIDPGCDKTRTTCNEVYVNLTRFGGNDLIPGPDKYLETPDAQQ